MTADYAVRVRYIDRINRRYIHSPLLSHTYVGHMDDLREELSALSDIFSEEELDVIWGDQCLAISFPLPFRLEIQFVITIVDSDLYDVLVQIIEGDNRPLELVRKAACAAQVAAEQFMADRERNEHKHLYSAHQRAVDAFDKCISSNCSTLPGYKGSDELECESMIISTSTEEVKVSQNEGVRTGQCPETTTIILDHINDTKKYFKALEKWSQQLQLSCLVFAKSPTGEKGDRTRHVVLVIQSQDENSEFLKRLKTENVDVNLAGKPCKERCSTTLLTSRKYNYFEIDTTFKIFDSPTSGAVTMLNDRYHAPEIGNAIRDFCAGKM